MNYLQLLKLAAPETFLVITALAVLGADLFALRELDLRFRRVIGAMISCAGCAGAIALILAVPHHANFQQGIFVVDPLTQLIKVALLVLTICTLLISMDTDFTAHTGEYFALILLAALGMM